MDAAEFWDRLKEWMRKSPLGGLEPFWLGPPATDEALRKLEAELGFSLPRAFHDLYLVHDGQTNEEAAWFLPYGTLMSVADIRRVWTRAHKDRSDEPYFDVTYAGDRIRGLVSHPKWVPITHSASGTERMILDFVPGPNGCVGQVLYPVDECMFVVVGSSLEDFFDRTIHMLEGGRIQGILDGENWGLEFDETELRTHPEDPYD